MKQALATLSLLALALLAPAVGATERRDDSLYQALGAQPGLSRLMDDFVPRLERDPRIGSFFKETKLEQLKAQLASQFCMVAGGPCKYEGAPMKDAHAEMSIRKADFNALVEALQQSMDAQGIAFATQNRLLARLAPMHRDIINTP